MALLEVKNLAHSFGEKVLYKDVSFELFKGEHLGIVGQNGAGKTTLLRSIIGDITPDTGDIRWQKNIRIGYLDQYAELNFNITIFDYLKTAFDDLYQIEKELNSLYEVISTETSPEILDRISDYQSLLINRGFYEIKNIVLKVTSGLGITSLGMDRSLKKLSGGQREKVILAKLLLESPDVLLLDEPTNFLDKEHVSWLADYLKSFSGAFMLISHDFEFLEKVATCILDIEFQAVTKYAANFNKFLKLKGLKKENYVKEFKAQRKEIKKLEEFIAKSSVCASTARLAQSRLKKLEKMNILTPPKNNPRPVFKLKSLPLANQKALKVNSLVVGYNLPLLPKLSFCVKPGEKIVITGFNGIGKSTLIKTLLGEIKAIGGNFKFADYVRVAYFEQELKWVEPDATPLQIIERKFPVLSVRELRKELSHFGIRAKNIAQTVTSLSGGEQSKVKLCLLVNTPSNFLILDEPTNHLDNETKEVLKEQLVKFAGNIILVSHEVGFYSEIVEREINLKKVSE